jgi:SNF2 domain-containing protein/helicase-like protein
MCDGLNLVGEFGTSAGSSLRSSEKPPTPTIAPSVSSGLIMTAGDDKKLVMSATTLHLELPLPLKLLQQTPPGLLYALASKPHIMLASSHCDRNIVARAEWNRPGNTTLTLICADGARVTMCGDDQLVTRCDCWSWTRNSQCPHVVTTWIQLKRLLSAGSFPHLKISSQVLRELSALVGIPGPEPVEQEKRLPDQRLSFLLKKFGLTYANDLITGDKPRQPGISMDRGNVRLVLEENYGRLRGTIKLGSESINQWTRGVPKDIAECLQRLPYYDSTIRYFSYFSSLTKGKYPIVYRNEYGTELPLTLRADVPRRACLAFSLFDGRVAITRTLDGNSPLPDNFITAHELLFDLDAGTIHPLTNREVWRVWDNIDDKLLSGEEDDFDDYFDEDHEDDFDDDFNEDYEDDFEADDFDDSGLLERGESRIVTTVDRFNALALRLNPNLIPDFSESVLFFHDGAAVNTVARLQPSYSLELPATLDTPLIDLMPLVGFADHLFTFSGDLFRFFDQQSRSHLSAPLKAKKRVRAIVSACFELAETATPAARNKVIKAALSGPDYVKRSVKREAKQILSTFVEESLQRPLMIQAAADGWRFAEDDRLAQIRLVRILHDLFGVDAFDAGASPGEMTVEQEQLLPLLPLLAGRLQQGGFSLRLGGEPLATAVWDFALDATSSTLDWFELRPEIRCDGELLSAEELQRLADGGILRRDGKLILIDDLSARVLAMLTGTASPGKRKKKGAQQAVRIPRLQILDWLQLRSHGVTVRLAPDDARILESLLNFGNIPGRPLPPGLTATLRPYQGDGYRWLGFLYEHRFGACLADDMGLGKTIQGISLLTGIADGIIATAASPDTPHLIVVPPSLLFNWESEIARFFPGAAVLTYTGQGRSIEAFNRHDIILTSYGIIQRDIELLSALRFNVIIYDEAQLVKNLQAATTSAARRLVGAFKLALTGTPVENRIEEYYAIMDLCLPGLLGTPEEFRRSIGNWAQGGIDTLLRRTRPFVLRRNKQLIAADLPDKIETDIHLELSPKQKTLYQRTIEEVRGQIDDAFANRSPGQARIIALTAILRLRQICLAPALALSGASDASPKLDFLLEQLDELRDEGHSVLVFSQFTSYLDIVEAGLKRHHLPCLRLDGATPVPQRKKLVQAFQDSENPTVFLISLKAGGKGLNLTRATYVYHLDPWWNPAVENQASDRAHRIGQTRQVTITRLIMRHTIEEKMMALKEQKFKLYKAILEEGTAGGGAGLTREDFDFLLG